MRSIDPSAYKRLHRFHQRRSHHFPRAAIVGALAGLFALFFNYLIHTLEEVRYNFLHQFPDDPAFSWAIIPLTFGILAGFSAWITKRYSPHAAGSGIPHVKIVLTYLKPLHWQNIIPVKIFGQALGSLAGSPLGIEGPTIHIGAAVGAAFADMMRLPRQAYNHLVACGAGAGLAAAFNTPLAGFIFVIEELRRELSPVTYGTALISAIFADIVIRVSIGYSPSFVVTSHPNVTLEMMPVIFLLGVVCGFCGIAFNRTLLWAMRKTREHSKIPAWARGLIVGSFVGVIALVFPEAIGKGHVITERILSGEFNTLDAVPFLLGLFLLKGLLTIVCYVSGIPGGIFAPLLILGSLMGMVISTIFYSFLPMFDISSANSLGVLGMAAMFTAIVHAPLTAIIMIIELTANYNLLFALMLVCLTAYIIVEWFEEEPIYDALLNLSLSSSKSPLHTHNKEAILLDLIVEPGSQMDRCRVSDLHLPRRCLLITVRRLGQEFVPNGRKYLKAGDEIVVVIEGHILNKLEEIRAMAAQR